MNTQLQNNILTVIFSCFLFLCALGQLQRLEFVGGALYLHDIGALFFIIIYCFTTPFKRTSLRLQTVSVPLILLICTGILISFSTLLGAITSQTIIPVLYICRLIFYGLFSLCVWQTYSNTVIHKSWFILLIGLLYGGFTQYILFPDTRFLYILGWDEHYYRLVGTLFDPAFIGLLYVFGLLVIITKTPFTTLTYCMSILFSIALAMTYSRSSWVALALALIYIAIIQTKHIKKFLPIMSVICIVMIITLWLAPKPGGEGVNISRTSTIEARSEHILKELTADLTLKEIFIGQGLFRAENYSDDGVPNHAKVPDNILILLFKGGGIVAVITGVLGFLLLGVQNLKQPILRNTLLIAVITHSMFNASLIQPFVLLVLLGLYSSTVEKKSTKITT